MPLRSDGSTESLDRKKGKEGKGNRKKKSLSTEGIRFSLFCQEMDKAP